MRLQTLARRLGEQFSLPEFIIRKILLGRRPPRIPEDVVQEIRRCAESMLQGAKPETYTHVRRAPRFAVSTDAGLVFWDAGGRTIVRGRGRISELSLCGARIQDVRVRPAPLPFEFDRLVVRACAMDLEARLARIEGDVLSVFAFEFIRMDWESRQRLKSLMIRFAVDRAD